MPIRNGLIEEIEGLKEYYKDGEIHREEEEGPAFDFLDNRLWYKENKLHRLNGPAVEMFDGTKEWYIEGKLHREAGPAIEHSNGYKEYWYLDKRIRCNSDEEYIRLINLKLFW